MLVAAASPRLGPACQGSRSDRVRLDPDSRLKMAVFGQPFTVDIRDIQIDIGAMYRCAGENRDGTKCNKDVAKQGDKCSRCEKCRAKTNKGKPCENKGNQPDGRCKCHKGQPILAPKKQRNKSGKKKGTKSSKPPSSSSAARKRNSTEQTHATQERRKNPRYQKEMVELCQNTLAKGGKDVIANNVNKHIDNNTWEKLTRHHTHHSCKELARLARDILDIESKIHSIFGNIIYWLLGWFGWPTIPRLAIKNLINESFASQVGGRIKVIAIARTLQTIGIWICFNDNRNLMECACFRDLVTEETKERIKKLLTTEWSNLPEILK